MTTMSFKPDPGYWAMPDAVNVNLLPAGYPAYLGYTDGRYQTANTLQALFPEAELVLLTVQGLHDLGAHGARVRAGDDVEPGDMTAAAAAAWIREGLAAEPLSRPVAYASVKGVPGYGMPDVIRELTMARIALSRVRLLSAHYSAGPHICGPASCGQIGTEMDGTQWTDAYEVPGGVVDMSLLKPDFFDTYTTPGPSGTEKLVRELPIVRQGDTGEAVRTVQSLCNARTPVPELSIDGMFGPRTARTVQALQADAHLMADGVVGPLTWPVLLGVA